MDRKAISFPQSANALDRLESRQDELLRRLDELEEQTRRVIADQTQWLREHASRLRPKAVELLKALESESRTLPLAG